MYEWDTGSGAGYAATYPILAGVVWLSLVDWTSEREGQAQHGLTPGQARELAAHLNRLADQAENDRKGDNK